jgi:tetratricopeptide (TPR) repeat protein
MWSILSMAFGKIVDKLLGGFVEHTGKTFTRWRRRSSIPAASGKKIALLLARLDGDTEMGSHRESVREAIRRELGNAVEIVLWPEALRVEEGHGREAELTAYRTAQNWLIDKRCDLLVWGRVKASNVISLRFTVSAMNGPESNAYKLTETLDLPMDFISALGVAISARVTIHATLAVSMRGHYLVPLMRHAAERLRPVVDHLNPNYDTNTRGSMLHTYALVKDTIGVQEGSNYDLEQAIEFYRKTLQEWTRERDPLGFATIHNNLGNALTGIGGFQNNTARLNEALGSYEKSLEEFPRERLPLDWANTKSNLGTALQVLGKLKGDTKQLEQSVACYRAALEVRTRERVPMDWAMTQNNLGNTLYILSTREESVKLLQDAIGAYLEALKERTRERVPLDWAQTVSNLAKALLTFGTIENNPWRIEAAIDGYQKALEVFQQVGASRYIAATRKSLAVAEEILAKHRGGNNS